MICIFRSSMNTSDGLLNLPVWIKISCWRHDLQRCRGSTLASLITQIPITHSRGYSTSTKWPPHILCIRLLLLFNYNINMWFGIIVLCCIIIFLNRTNSVCSVLDYFLPSISCSCTHVYTKLIASIRYWQVFTRPFLFSLYLLQPSIYLFHVY